MDAAVAQSAAEERRQRRWTARGWALLALLLGLGATFAAWHQSREAAQAAHRVAFQFVANNVVNEINDRLQAHVQTLWGAASLIAATPEITRAQWRAYVDALQMPQRLPGARAIGFAKRVPRAERDALERAARAQGFDDYAITPAGERDEFVPVTLIEPLDARNRGLLGVDLWTLPERHAAMVQARDHAAAAITAKLTLVGEAQSAPQPGFLLFLPVYRPGEPTDTVEARRAALVGFVYSPFRASDFINGPIADYARQHGATFEIYDGAPATESDLLYRSPGFPQQAASVVHVAEAVAGRTWTFRLAALPTALPADRQVPAVVLVAGILISLLASAVVGAFQANRAQAQDATARLRADVARRERAEAQLRDSERRFRQLFDNLPLPAFAIDRQTLRYLTVNEAAVAKYGYSHEEFAGMPITDLRPPEDVPAVLQYMQSVRDKPSYAGEFRHQTRDGRRIEVELTAHNFDLDNRPATIVVAHDITERKRAQQALIDNEQRLRQSQKLEAIGQLTGGIAHDFNNILTVITGTIEILAEGVAGSPKLAAIAKLIDEAATRGADLTRDLLAFARRQPLQPQDTDINALVLGAAKLFRSTLGEHIEIDSRLDFGLWPAYVDPSQLTTALLNLALNARDAMPAGGRLVIETGNAMLDESYVETHVDAHAGSYVMIAVSDTGTGIPPDVIDKVFEPFFTTKELGKGTGLGLSMVYGFVKQSGGHIKIYSEPGHGTSVKLYLPRAAAAAGAVDTDLAVAPAGGSETILAVEDDALVRTYVTAQLQSLGYTTIVAANAAEALAVVERGTPFDLLFTDVVMPGPLNGQALAQEVLRRRPRTRVLFTSGYTEHAAVLGGKLDPGMPLLNKPYRKADLARKLRQALDAAPA